MLKITSRVHKYWSCCPVDRRSNKECFCTIDLTDTKNILRVKVKGYLTLTYIFIIIIFYNYNKFYNFGYLTYNLFVMIIDKRSVSGVVLAY